MEDCTGTRLFDLLNEDYLTDVTFQVQDVEVKAHRLVLISGGGVLKKLLEENSAEAAGNKIKIEEDVTSEVFKNVLKFIYTDSCEVNDTNLFEVTHAATVFKLDRLEKYCANVTKIKLAVSNVGAYASYAVEVDAKESVKVCQEYFRTNTLQVIKTDEFLKISYDVLLALCSSEGITCSELDLFFACVEWAKRECQRKRWEVTPENQRTALGDVLKKIRFPVMKKEEFEDKVVPLEILTYEEVGRLIVGWRKMEHRTDFSDEFRTEVVQVGIGRKAIVPLEILTYEEVGRLIVGWKKKEQRTDFSDELRTEIVQVTITDHRACKYPDWNSNLTVPLSTRIKDLKGMKIFCNGNQQCHAEKFTLAHKGTILRNEDTLASIYTPGEKLVIDVHSIDVTVKDKGGQWQFPLTVKSSEMVKDSNLEQVVKGAVYSHKAIQPDQVYLRLLIDGKEYSVQVHSFIPGRVVRVCKL